MAEGRGTTSLMRRTCPKPNLGFCLKLLFLQQICVKQPSVTILVWRSPSQRQCHRDDCLSHQLSATLQISHVGSLRSISTYYCLDGWMQHRSCTRGSPRRSRIATPKSGVLRREERRIHTGIVSPLISPGRCMHLGHSSSSN